MKKVVFQKLAVAGFFVASGFLANAGTLIVSDVQPANSIFANDTNNNSFTRIFAPALQGGNDSHGRGGVFVLADNLNGSDYLMESVSIQASTAQTFSNSVLTLWVFEGTAEDWVAGDGDEPVDATDLTEPDLFDGTGITNIPVDGESFDLNVAVANNGFLTLQLDSAVVLQEGVSYGMMITLTQGGSDPVFLQVQEESSAIENLSIELRLLSDSNTAEEFRSMDFWIGGSAVTSEDIAITDFSYNEETETISLTWNSTPGQAYIVSFSPDLMDWDGNVGDNYMAAEAGNVTTEEIDLSEFGVSGVDKLFFRVGLAE